MNVEMERFIVIRYLKADTQYKDTEILFLIDLLSGLRYVEVRFSFCVTRYNYVTHTVCSKYVHVNT